jgi:FkbH-like protein
MDNQKSIVISSTFAAEPLREPLSFWLNRLQLPGRLVFAPELQLMQNLLDARSVVNTNTAGLNVVVFRWQDLDANGRAPDRAWIDLTESMRVAIRGPAPLLVITCPSSPRPDAAVTMESVWDDRLAREFNDNSRVSVITTPKWQDIYPVASSFENGGDEFALIPYSPATYAVLGTLIARKFHMLATGPYKVIVVDCDDTLWDGACGEEGPDGVRLEARHLEFQQFLRRQIQRGCLICLCSKNNSEDVKAVFCGRSDMILQWEDIAATKINWRPKTENLTGLADELGLATDSFIFIDDNPVECEIMRKSLPEVLTLQLPADRAGLKQFLGRVWAFDRSPPTAEDRQRVSFYRQEREREQLRQTAATLEAFIAGLDLRVQLQPLSEENLSRASQLSYRVNQFNVTTIRRTEAELAGLRRDGLLDGWLVDVSDRFGSYGLVGLVLFRAAPKSLKVDTLLLSCRALGRGVEHRLAISLAEHAKSLGLDSIDVFFASSGKNHPAQEFLESEFGDYGRVVETGVEYQIPVQKALSVRHTLPRKRDLVFVPVDHRTAVQKNQDFQETRAAVLAWIAADLPTGDTIHAAISESTRRENGGLKFVPPRSSPEHQIAEIWAEVLGLTKVGIRDNFFEIGGDSLAIVRVILRVYELTGFELPIRAFFEAPTIEQQLFRYPIWTRSAE